MLFPSAFLLLYLAGLLNPFGIYFMIRNLFFPLFLFKMTHLLNSPIMGKLKYQFTLLYLCIFSCFLNSVPKTTIQKSNLLNYSQLMNFLRQIYFSPGYTMSPGPSMALVCRLHFWSGESETRFLGWFQNMVGRELLSGVFLEKHQGRRADLLTGSWGVYSLANVWCCNSLTGSLWLFSSVHLEVIAHKWRNGSYF